MKYGSIYNELNKSSSHSPILWLIYAESSKGMSLTKGSLSGYSDYSSLIAYSEEFNVVNSQYHGVKGICSSNVLITIPKDANSLNIYNQFASGSILNTVKILQIVDLNNKLNENQEVTFKSCKIESFKSYMDKAIILINYNSRKEKFIAYNSDGTKRGNCIG